MTKDEINYKKKIAFLKQLQLLALSFSLDVEDWNPEQDKDMSIRLKYISFFCWLQSKHAWIWFVIHLCIAEMIHTSQILSPLMAILVIYFWDGELSDYQTICLQYSIISINIGRE